jgi:hypothetical protein
MSLPVEQILISADDHLDIHAMPPDAWSARLPKAWRERGPHVEETPDGPYWFCDGQRVSLTNAFTRFGKVSYEINSHVAQGYIEATITPPTRRRSPKRPNKREDQTHEQGTECPGDRWRRGRPRAPDRRGNR